LRILDNEKAETLTSVLASVFGTAGGVLAVLPSALGVSIPTVPVPIFSSEFGIWDLLFGISAFADGTSTIE
jgi:hypothetical protein